MRYGPWVERLEAVAVARELVAVAGRRDAAGVISSHVHVIPTALLDGRAPAGRPMRAAIYALGFAGDELLLGGGDDGKLIAWDVTGQKRLAELDLKAPIRSLALDTGAARGDAGSVAVGTADGALHIIKLAIQNATPVLGRSRRAVGWRDRRSRDVAGLWVAGGADGQPCDRRASVRCRPAVMADPRGRVLGDGRAAIGCGDGWVR